MENFKHLSFTLLCFLAVQQISAQKLSLEEWAKKDSTQRSELLKARRKKIDSLKTIDYLSYDYKYLNRDFEIKMSSRKFQKTMEKYDFIPQRIVSYKDSLSVVLMTEFNDWNQANISQFCITYSWFRLGYHIWQTSDEAQDFAAQFGIKHPWRMREFLVDESNTDPIIAEFFKDLQFKVEEETRKTNLDSLNREALLNKAFRSNPQRIIDFKKKQEEVRRKRMQHQVIDKNRLQIRFQFI
ncbi:MAG: hypothetical protein MI866_03245 [Bacteroidales bacterium]|nr:hypothetical protein [Bacteroidales bacterium]